MKRRSDARYPFPLKIVGVGRYVPERVVSSNELESRFGLEEGWCQAHHGIRERRWIVNETASLMGAEAAKEAVSNAGMDFFDIDLIINASSSFERYIPDGGPLIQRHLGLDDSGIPCTTLNASCLSFLAAVDLSASLITVGRYRNILIVSSETMSPILGSHDPGVCTLFGDGAASVVVTLAQEGEASGIHSALLETYGHGIPYMQSLLGFASARNGEMQPDRLALQMDIDSFMKYGMKYTQEFLDQLLDRHKKQDIELVIPQQSGKSFLDHLRQSFAEDKLVKIVDRFGFCGAASLPMALYEAVKEERLKRNDLFLLVGFGAGLSVGGMVVTY